MSYFCGYFWFLVFVYLGTDTNIAIFIGLLASIMIAKNEIIKAIKDE